MGSKSETLETKGCHGQVQTLTRERDSFSTRTTKFTVFCDFRANSVSCDRGSVAG